MMQAADAVEEIFRNLGIDHLVSTVKDILKLRNLILLKLVTHEEFEQVLKAVDIPAERRALLMAFEQVSGERSDEKLNSMESEIREAIKQAGFDDNVWVRKIKEGFKLESVEKLKSVTEEQIEVFLKPIAIPIQSVLVKLFGKVTKIDMAKLNIPEKPGVQRTDVTAAEAVRSVQAGVLCQGIFMSEEVNELIQEREMVIDVSENLEFKETRSVHEIFHNEFACKEAMQTFVNHLDKHLSERSASIGVNILGVSLDKADKHSREDTSQPQNFISSVHYQGIPVATVDISPDKLHLRPEVIDALQHVEKSMKKADYKPKDHFKDFFKIYGTHISHGTIEFGGTLVSTAYCEGFREENRKRITDAVIEASEAAILLDVNKKVRPGQPFNAYEIFGRNTGINTEDFKNITVIVKKIGGHQNVVAKEDWKERLRETCEQWDVVKRASPPKPLWKILLQHTDKFENYLALSNGMQEEWKRNTCSKGKSANKTQSNQVTTEVGEEEESVSLQLKKTPKMRIEICEKEKQRSNLRREIQLWIERFSYLSSHNVHLGIRNLASLRKKYYEIKSEWQNEVLYLRDVQMRLVWTGKLLQETTDPMQRLQLVSALKHVLNPIENIYIEHFQDIRDITEKLKEFEGNSDTHFVVVDDLRQLSDALKENLNVKEEADVMQLQERIEFGMKASQTKGYSYLLCLGVLRLFGFSPDSFLFDHLLEVEDISSMAQQLEIHFGNWDPLPENLKQAYIFKVGLCSPTRNETMIRHILDNIPGGICNELNDTYNQMHCYENGIDLEKFHLAVNKMLQKGGVDFDLQSLAFSLKSQLFVHHKHSLPMERVTRRIEEHAMDKDIKTILEAMNMMKYYQQKLTYEEVIMLGTDVQDDVNKKPTSLPELPWYFMKRVIGLDSCTRENCHVANFLDYGSDNEEDSEEMTLSSIHPLDLIYIIFLCADDFLRQELVDKMARCQYGVPFILPSGNENNLVLHWGLRSVARTFYNNNNVINKTLVDAEAPLVACMNVGEETSWKSKLLNKLLSPQQETFWHQGLKGGNCKQRISQGMVEVAWYLPGRHGDNRFSYPVNFVNVRQNAVDSDILCNRLYNSSTVTCLFAQDVDEDLQMFLKQKPTLENILLIILYKKEREKQVKEATKHLQTRFNLEKHQVIRKVAQDANFDAVYELLKKSIEHVVELVTHSGSLSTFVMHAKETEGMEIDDKNCYFGQMAAESILRDIDECNARAPGSAKGRILSCQSDLVSRQEIASLDKELYRQRKLAENMTVQNYWYDLKEKKWQMQLSQLLKPVSDSFKYFLKCLVSLDTTDKKYFLQSLKLGLNERSTQQLQPLYEEYEKCRIEEESEERDRKLKKIDEQLTYGSLGIEHFFREMAVMYENISALKEKTLGNEVDKILDLLADAMAAVLMEGHAVEVMDGDAINVPVAWLKAVLNKVENSKESTLFKVAVLGAQSCGKSTLLNTVFGLNFPVSSGRCTRGAYMQLVKVDEALKETLKCDYVAVIDSEGLMSRTKMDGTDYDNELSTFIIGLSDLTLVIIKGEGNEMHDVLPLAIHVFLRMNILGEHQACHFVHQNMGAVDVMTKVATEIDAFVRDLNAKTLAAAKDVDQSDRYTKFTDVLQYDPTTDNTYVPGLWDGTPPMGKTNSHYSRIMAKLKTDIANCIVDMQKKQKKGVSTFGDISKRLDELWDAIKYENFVLSFKNVLAVEAHRKLSKVFDEEQWNLKREIRELVKLKIHVIENEVKSGKSARTVKQLTESSLQELINCLTSRTAEIEETIMHYFQCAGCDGCSAAVANRHLLSDNEKEFQDDVRILKRALVREVESTMENLEVKMKTDKRIHELSTEMDDILKRKVQEAIASQKTEHLTPENIEETFHHLWTDAAGDILRKAKDVERNENIEATVQATIRSLFGPDDHLYLQIQTGKGPSKWKDSGKSSAFKVDPKMHMKLITVWAKLGVPVYVNKEDVHRLQAASNSIIADTSQFYCSRSASSDGKQFSQSDVELLFKDVLKRIEVFRDERFKTTNLYKVHLVHYIQTQAIAGFSEMHDKYCNKGSPSALLEEKKKSYHDLFVIKLGQGNAAAKFCETVLKDMVLKNVDEYLSCTELLHDLRVHCGEMFRDIKSIQASIMVRLFKEKSFNLYQEYISDYKKFVTDEMSAESIKYFKDGRFKALAATKLDEVISEILQAVDETVTGIFAGEPFMKTFFSKIDGLKILHNEASAYMELDVPDAKQFAEIIRQQLQGQVKEQVKNSINSWSIIDKLKEKGLAEFLFREVVGCNEKCPFCKVPCDNHSGGKTQGQHTATLHRPQGLGAYRYEGSECLVSADCCSSIASEAKFRCRETTYMYQPYKEYHKWFPNWTIHGNANPDVEKYWKWVFAYYNRNFAKYYSANPAHIPLQWHTFLNAEIKKDVEDNYHVQVDASAFK